LFVCLFVCLCGSNNSKSYGRIFLKFWEYVGHGINYQWFNFWGDPKGILDFGSLWNFHYHCVKGGIREPLAKRMWWRHLANSFALAEVPAGYDCFSSLNITTTTTDYYPKIWEISLVQPSYSQFCLKYYCYGDRGRWRVNTRKGEGEGEGGKREREVITVDGSVAACAVEWHDCYYDVMQAPLHYESSCARTNRKSDYLIFANVHYVHLGRDKNLKSLYFTYYCYYC